MDDQKDKRRPVAKPVGVAFADHDGEGYFAAIVVVCDDGSVWVQRDLGELGAGGWSEGAPVPETIREKELEEEKK